MGQASDLRLQAIETRGGWGAFLRLIGPPANRFLGLHRMRRLYERSGMAGLGKYEFIERFISYFKIRYSMDPAELSRIPASGPVIVVANHPLGGLEGIILAGLLRKAREDYKLFVNVVQFWIREMRDFYIFANPAAPGSKMNFLAMAESRRWLSAGHCLLVFPAGRVGIWRPDLGCVSDEPWDQMALSLGSLTNAAFVPLFVGGSASRSFSLMARYVYPWKLLGLVWEFLKSFKTEVSFRVGRPIQADRLASMPRRTANAWLRMRTYLLSPPNPELHPEVGRYFRRHGFKAGELEELLEALEGMPDSQEALRRLAGSLKKGRGRDLRA